MKKFMMMFAIVMILFLAACGSGENNGKGQNGEIVITTTTGQIADAVTNVGGDLVEVEALMGPGVDPHLYQATQSDIRKLGNADMIFYNGLHLEGNMGDILEQIDSEKPTKAVANGLPDDQLQQDMENPNEVDPHIWFDLDLWALVVNYIADELSEFSPENEEIFRENAENYQEELEELKTYAEDELATIPDESRILVTAHDAFGYFATAFDFEVIGIQGLSTDSDYGVADIQDIVSVLVDHEVKAVFTESSVSERAMESVIEGAERRGQEVTIGGELFSDAMGEEGTEQGTYIGMFKHNIDVIVSSLK
ncbi:metal ABC transporter solute-binding protein, Zn/Mn family [Alkalibacillus aidingensis]|uniref:metal ABC transporter solute-binding protein, Zn/Mn family n=1 Tax=Alkalibacillus aidingensis TaxID=2747607 RepID=UPI002948C2BD|nr:zinc ABC transporter substrate-binding protein [Alkalibacillus aidingensis]